MRGILLFSALLACSPLPAAAQQQTEERVSSSKTAVFDFVLELSNKNQNERQLIYRFNNSQENAQIIVCALFKSADSLIVFRETADNSYPMPDSNVKLDNTTQAYKDFIAAFNSLEGRIEPENCVMLSSQSLIAVRERTVRPDPLEDHYALLKITVVQ